MGEPVVGEHIGPYVVEGRVARGGMATVLAVRDVRDDRRVALKLLNAMPYAEEARTRFRREFRALSRLHHPNVLKVYEWGLRGDRAWYSMELVSGRTLKREVETWARLEPEDRFARTQAILVEVARALQYIHDRGLVHRDVTPSNLMIGEGGAVKLMDFGVVKDLGTDLTAVGDVVGTVAYIAPEQVRGGAIDVRADLYTLGAVLYFMLTGQRPFEARTLQGYLEKHLRHAPRPPRAIDPLVPPLLDEICLRLLEKDPSDRYASAAHLLHVLGDIPQARLVDGHWPPQLVGRTLECARIYEGLQELASESTGSALLVAGGPGSGKTRILDTATQEATRLGLRVARGRCRHHDRPFGAFIGVLEGLGAEDAPEILRSALLGDDDGVVRERYPVISAFREFILSHAPVVVILDDLESADGATTELLAYLIRNTLELAAEPVTFVLAVESTPTSPAPVERALPEVLHRLDLASLSQADVEELMLTILPTSRTSTQLARRIHTESGGSPAFISDMLRGLRDEGALAHDGEAWQLTLDEADITRSRLPMPASLRQALEARVVPLSKAATSVARVVALARRRLDLDALVEIAPMGEEEVMDALDELIEAEIVDEFRSGDTEEFELSHVRFRDVLLDGLGSSVLKRRHRRFGEVVERLFRHRPARVVEELAFHFEQAGVPPKAYAYLVRTGLRHLNRSLYEESLGFLERALRMEPQARPFMLLDEADEKLCRTLLALSQAQHHLGNWEAALAAARRAKKIADQLRNSRLLSRVAAELGNQLRGIGEVDEAERLLRLALDRAAETGDASLRPMPLYQLGGIVWARGDLDQAETLWREALKTAQDIGDERSTGYGFNGLGILAICRGSSMEARRHLEQSAKLFERLGMLAPLAISRINLAELYLSAGILRKALALTERTIAQSREVHHIHGTALGLTLRAQVLMDLGREEEALRNAREALRVVRALGQTEDEVVALATLVKVDLLRARPDRALVRLEELAPLLEDYDTEGIRPEVTAWRAHALAALGRSGEALAVLEASENPDRQWPHVQVRTDLATGRAWSILGERDQANPILKRALTVAESNGYRFYQLQANHELALLAEDDATRARYSRIAVALARSLAANLPGPDSRGFLARGWGEVPEES